RYHEAEQQYNRVLRLGPDGPRPELYPIALGDLGLVFFYLDRFQKAAESFEEAVQRFAQLGPSADLYRAQSLGHLASIRYRQHHPAEAERFLLQALALQEKAGDAALYWRGTTLLNLAVTCTAQKRYREAEDYFKRSLAIQESLFGAGHIATRWTMANYAG